MPGRRGSDARGWEFARGQSRSGRGRWSGKAIRSNRPREGVRDEMSQVARTREEARARVEAASNVIGSKLGGRFRTREVLGPHHELLELLIVEQVLGHGGRRVSPTNGVSGGKPLHFCSFRERLQGLARPRGRREEATSGAFDGFVPRYLSALRARPRLCRSLPTASAPHAFRGSPDGRYLPPFEVWCPKRRPEYLNASSIFSGGDPV